MSAIGKKINNMDMVLKYGQMLPNMKETMSLVKSTELELLNGLMDQHT